MSEEHELYVLFIYEKTFTEFEHEKNIRKDDISHLFSVMEKRQLAKETFKPLRHLRLELIKVILLESIFCKMNNNFEIGCHLIKNAIFVLFLDH